MIIKKYTAKSEEEAIDMAKNELGNNAIVLNIKKKKGKGLARFFVRSKVEITAAVDDDKSDEKSNKTNNSNKNIKENKNKKSKIDIEIGSKDESLKQIKESNDNNILRMPNEAEISENEIQEKIKKLDEFLGNQVSQEDKENNDNVIKNKDVKEIKEEKEENKIDKKIEKKNENEKTLAYKALVREQLIQNEVDIEIVDKIMEEINQSLPVDASLDQILANVYQRIILMLGKPYLIGDSDSKNRTKYIFFLGSTGVGKTTTIAKIASKLKLERKANVALVTSDTYRIAAVEQLKTYANILSIPLKVVYTAQDLGEVMDELDEYDYCLVDTAGRSHKSKEQIDDIKNLMEEVPINERQVYLVLNAGTKYKDLKEIAKVYSELTDYSIIFTKLDETSSAGAMLNMHVKTGCPLSYVTWGQNVPDDIGEIDPQKVAKQLLGGH